MFENLLLRAALDGAAAGIPVVPLHSPAGGGRCTCNRQCRPVGKHPRLRNGMRDACTDDMQIRAWWRRWPHANVGFVTGVVMDVVDVDSEQGLDAVLSLVGREVFTGPAAATGSGGWHLSVAPTGLGNRVGFLPGVDWRGRGG